MGAFKGLIVAALLQLGLVFFAIILYYVVETIKLII
jgi:hypothetical protein